MKKVYHKKAGFAKGFNFFVVRATTKKSSSVLKAVYESAYNRDWSRVESSAFGLKKQPSSAAKGSVG